MGRPKGAGVIPRPVAADNAHIETEMRLRAPCRSAGTELFIEPGAEAPTAARVCNGCPSALLVTSRPAAPNADPLAVVRQLASDLFESANSGTLLDAAESTRVLASRYDEANLAHAAYLIATGQAERRLAAALSQHADAAFAAWTTEARRIAGTYADALAGQPTGEEIEALRKGGKAAARWQELNRLRDACNGLVTSWRALRMLLISRDQDIFQASARFERQPEGGIDLLRQYFDDNPDTSWLDAAVHFGTHDALVLDSRADQRARIERWHQEERTRPRPR